MTLEPKSAVDVPRFLVELQQVLSAELDRLAPAADRSPIDVHRAIRYTLLGSSKRARGILTLLAARLFQPAGDPRPAAAAIELVHASSLILDDLPAMDDTPTRRGRPANHVAFGEATSILAAVGLLNLAFGHLVASYDAPLAMKLTQLLSETVGSDGLIGGQAADLRLPAQALKLADLEPVHDRKTAVLFRAAAVAGAMVGGATDGEITALNQFGEHIGLAFQIVDDVLDVEGDAAGSGGVPLGISDRQPPHVAWIADPARGRSRALELKASAVAAIDGFGERARLLRDLARFLVERNW